MKKALFPGMFNPPTVGHLNIIKRASALCDHLVVAVTDNKAKPGLQFTIEERVQLLKTICSPYSNVEILSFQGLVIDFAKQVRADAIIRGIRSTKDLEYEEPMAVANRKMSGIETLFLLADSQYMHVSAALIREIGSFGQRLYDFVPSEIEPIIFEKFSKRSV